MLFFENSKKGGDRMACGQQAETMSLRKTLVMLTHYTKKEI